jgi:RNA polymerase-binding protein DksA
MADSGKGITGRVRRVVADAASAAARSVTGGRRRGSTKAAATTAAPKMATVTKAAPKKAAATKAVPKKAAATKAAPNKAAATKPVKKAPVKKAPVKKAPVKKAPVKKAPVKKAPAKKAPANKAPAKKAPAKKAPAKKAPAKRAPAKMAGPEALVVRADEAPWTAAELAEVRALLEGEATRLREEISEAESDIADLLRDSSDTGGEDQADTGSKTFEREHEMSLAASHREILGQTERALSRIDDGSYGVCESCGNPIGKARLQAFPRATLCMTCKQREERR